MSAIAAVSWDVDGTLYSGPRLRLSLAALAARALADERGAADLCDLARLARHHAAIDRLRRAGGPFRLPVDREAMRAVEARVLAAALRRTGPRRAARAGLDLVSARGLRQVAISDWDPGPKLEALGLAARFEATFSSERVGALKPDPAVFRAALTTLGIAPDALLHVGDRDDRDGAAARAAGCRFLLWRGDERSLAAIERALAAA